MKKILFIMLERDSASGLCVSNISQALAEKGYEVDIVSYETDTPIVKKDGINRLYIPAKFFLRQVYNNASSVKTRQISAYLYSIQVALTSLFIWPINSPVFIRKLTKFVNKLYSERKYEIVVPVYSQIDPLFTGNKLKRRYKDVIYIPYFLDSLSGGPTPRLLSERRKVQKGLKWEKKLLKNADQIVIMKSSEEHHKKYSQGMPYFAKMHFLDVPMLVCPNSNLVPQKKAEKVVINYIGSMPLSIRSPYFGFEVLSKLPNVEINVIGPIPNNDQYIEFCKQHGINLLGAIPHVEVGQYFENADFLINIGNNISEMVPCKIFEYMSYGKPILSFVSIEDDSSTPYLTRYPAAHICRNGDNIDKCVMEINSFIGKFKNCRIPFQQLEEIFTLNMPERFVSLVDSVLSDMDNPK